MQIRERLAWENLASSGSLVGAHVSGRLPASLQGPRWVDRDRNPAPRDLSPTLLDDLLAELDPVLSVPWRIFRESGARAVVTGQQPGCVGGPLLVLYKAATACALAERAAIVLERPVVPVFWNAADDDDYDEIARVAWPHPERGLLYLELPGDERRAGGWVGDLPDDRQVAKDALGLLAPEGKQRLASFLPDRARDHAGWVASFLHRVFPQLAILDGRSPALRRHGAPLFARFLESRDRVRDRLREARAGLRDAGYDVQLGAEETWVGLFWTAERSRRKAGSDLEPLRRAVHEAPETLSPNVVLRVLLQDLLLPTVAHVVGPAELHYLVEMRGLRALLDVPEPAAVLRLTQTVVEKELWEAARAYDLGVSDLVRDPERSLRSLAHEKSRPGRETATTAFDRLEAELARWDLSPTVRKKTGRRLGAVLVELLAGLEATTRQRILERRPALARLGEEIRPRDREQERSVAALWLLALCGPETGRTLVQHAKLHLDTLEKQRLEHFVVVA